ncbi:glycosyltransferase [Chitinophagaceae bacterium LB-8]|uniref:Glycosyltransferase n=1 Tax=Paraflavisolibacter caeni TaxID=2982496 RepID=A0A9X2XWI0_9BACT|nr:glycosyltransferase family 2 protein [Paraflavisolibacter caeni]MCU7550350.1 glycosyltransferase [Paraflavisolibacter caeni]
MSDCFISICIPAYKRTDYLQRLLQSIAVQTYRDFEVIVTDDSPNDEVKQLCNQYSGSFPLHFYKNPQNLNTPENWNEGIRKSKGEWIKLVHDDDWFSSPESLAKFAEAAKKHPGHTFFFSAYTNIYEGTGRMQEMRLKPFWSKALLQNPMVLISDNVVGPPSVTMHKNDKTTWYDRNMKYVVDIDFYIRYLENTRPYYIDEPLINVGINQAQVTKYTFGVPEVHLKESLLLLEKTGPKHLKNMIVFDGWWRLIRNFSVKNVDQLCAFGYNGPVPQIIERIIQFQNRIPAGLLKNGIISKSLMSCCYLLGRNKI